MQVELGQRYKDKVHGLEGVVVSRTEYQFARPRVAIERVVEGKIETTYCEEEQLEIGASV